MPKTNAEYCRDYRNKKRENKIKKIPKSSTERVREFRARRKALLNVENDSSIKNNDFSVQNSQNDHNDIPVNISNEQGDALIENDILNNNFTAIKTRWKNLRAYFIKVHRKSDKPKGGGHLPTITWQFYDQLAFLKQCTAGLDKDTVPIENEDSNSTLDDTADDTADDNDKVDSDSDSNSEETKAKRPRTSNSTVKSEPFDYDRNGLDGEEFGEGNDDRQFFESLLPYVQNIPLMRKLKLRCKIQEMILKELEAVGSVPATQQPPQPPPQQQPARFTEVYVDNIKNAPEISVVTIKQEPAD